VSYITKRKSRHWLPVDEDAVTERFGSADNFPAEDPKVHPHLVMRSVQAGHAHEMDEVSADLPDELKTIASATVVVTGIGGDFGLYAGSWDGEGWDWPKRVKSKDDVDRRLASLLQLDRDDFKGLAEAVNRLAKVSGREEGNSPEGSSSSPMDGASTSPDSD